MTRQIDRTAGNALNGAGGAAGKAHLGDDAGKAVNGLTDRPSEAGGNQGLTGANR